MLTKTDVQKIKQAIKEEAVTKAESKNFAMKNDLIGLAKSSDFDELKITFTDNLAKWKDELFTKIDSVLGRVKTAEEENVVLRAREDSRQEERQVLEGRINKLESIHPNNRHIQS